MLKSIWLFAFPEPAAGRSGPGYQVGPALLLFNRAGFCEVFG